MATKKKNPASEAARVMQSLRRNRRGGRPAVVRPCPKCGKPFSAVELRAHKPRCGK